MAPRAVVLVEGASDRAALAELARRRGDDLTAGGVAVIAMGGATNVGHHARRWEARGVRLGGLCDAGEAAWFARALGRPPTPAAEHGVGVCVDDLEDELIRALGVAGVEEVIASDGRLGSLRTLRRQPAQRDRLPREHLHRFLGARSGYKERYARLLVGAVDLDRAPPVLHAVLDHALRWGEAPLRSGAGAPEQQPDGRRAEQPGRRVQAVVLADECGFVARRRTGGA